MKVVQRLPVRIDLVDGNPTDAPLFVGLSVEPIVKVTEPPTGPFAGQKLQRPVQPASSPANLPAPLPPGTGPGGPPPLPPEAGARNAATGKVIMSTAPVAPRTVNPWFIALTVTIATFMEVLDTSIANVALPHIAGDLGASIADANWVLTGYLVANAIIIPLSSWLSTAFGRKRYYIGCVALFTLTSALCGLAANLPMLILWRIIQGIAGGGLQPVSQAILLDTFPAERRPAGMAVYGVAALQHLC